MKKTILFTFVCIPIFALAQKSKSYLKIAPMVLVPKNDAAAPGIEGGFGVRGKYVAGGISAGFVKLPSLKGIFLIGGEITMTEFGVNKVRPIINAGVHYPVLNDEVRTGTGASLITITTKGKLQYGGSAGVAFPIKGKKLFLTGGFTKLKLQSITKGRAGTSYYANKTDYDLDLITVSIGVLL